MRGEPSTAVLALRGAAAIVVAVIVGALLVLRGTGALDRTEAVTVEVPSYADAFSGRMGQNIENAVQMALGARRVWITGALVLESLVLTFSGGLLGIGVGSALVQALAAIQARNPNEAMEFLGQPTISVPIAVTTVLLLGGIGLLAGYFPARRAVTIQPAVALRYE